MWPDVSCTEHPALGGRSLSFGLLTLWHQVKCPKYQRLSLHSESYWNPSSLVFTDSGGFSSGCGGVSWFKQSEVRSPEGLVFSTSWHFPGQIIRRAWWIQGDEPHGRPAILEKRASEVLQKSLTILLFTGDFFKYWQRCQNELTCKDNFLSLWASQLNCIAVRASAKEHVKLGSTQGALSSRGSTNFSLTRHLFWCVFVRLRVVLNWMPVKSRWSFTKEPSKTLLAGEVTLED